MHTAVNLTRKQSRNVDRVAIEEYGMSGLVLMENAGRGCVDLLVSKGAGGRIAILCGKGNNGGDGFVIARHLWIRGHEARVLCVPPPHELSGDAAINYQILDKANADIVQLTSEEGAAALPDVLDTAASGCDWLVDALLGTGVTGAPRPPYDTIIEWINAEKAIRFAVDVPSGLNCDTGAPSATTVRADVTATFVASKVGYEQPSAQPFLGELHVVDIGIPSGVVERALAY